MSKHVGWMDWAVGYGYVEVEDTHGRECVIRCGSDDGIKIWLNGKVVHSKDVSRTYDLSSDQVSVYLKPGTNRLLVKVTNHKGDWGFGVSIPKASW